MRKFARKNKRQQPQHRRQFSTYELNHHGRIDALVMPVFEKKKKREKECDVRCVTLQAPNFVAAAGAMGTGGRTKTSPAAATARAPSCREPFACLLLVPSAQRRVADSLCKS